MEKIGSLERDTIMGVLSEGRNLANELKRNLDSREASYSCDALVENILSSYENAIKLLDCMDMLDGVPSPPAHVSSDLPNSTQGSPLSEASSDLTSKDHKCKKRKTLPKWSEQVRVRSDTGFEGQLDDGYNWRKYGQKDILGANHPRAYYRCTHRNTQGCLATKQVQRVDDDPSFFDVIYRGKHSCMQERLKQNNKADQNNINNLKEGSMALTHETTCLKTENQELQQLVKINKEVDVDPFPSFSFPSTPIESERFFTETSDFTGGAINYSPPFLSPATSESYFSMSHCPVNDFGNDLAEIISNPSPFPTFPLGDLDVSIDQIDFTSQLLDYY